MALLERSWVLRGIAAAKRKVYPSARRGACIPYHTIPYHHLCRKAFIMNWPQKWQLPLLRDYDKKMFFKKGREDIYEAQQGNC